MKKVLATGAVISALVMGFANLWLHAQPVVANQVSGNECWNAGQGPGGTTTGFLCLNTVRGGTSVSVLSSVAGSFTVGAAASTAAAADGGNIIITAQPSAATITMPPNPVADGSDIGICNGTNSAFATNVVTVAANSGQTMVPTGANITLTTLAAQTCFRYQWSQSTLSWYRVQ